MTVEAEKLKDFADVCRSGKGSCNRDNFGDDFGFGSGSCSGFGSLDGFGTSNGNGISNGKGSRQGDGRGYGRGYGSGYGIGNSSGNGFGYSSGNGNGNGKSSGEGSSYGDCYGNGYSSYKIRIRRFKGETVHYVDRLPCVFRRVHDNWAEVDVINNNDFALTRAFVARLNGCVAHGSSIREAFEDARDKWLQAMDFDEKRAELLKAFDERKKLTVRELYGWHGALTGSCRFGRSEFQTEHGLKDTDELTLEEFIKLTENAFGGDKIRSLRSRK